VGVVGDGAGVAVMDLGEGVLAVTLCVHPSQVSEGAAFVPDLLGRADLRTEVFLITGIAVALIGAIALAALIATTVSFSAVISSSDLISRHSGFQALRSRGLMPTGFREFFATILVFVSVQRLDFPSHEKGLGSRSARRYRSDPR
jgi:hypothetical protein